MFLFGCGCAMIVDVGGTDLIVATLSVVGNDRTRIEEGATNNDVEKVEVEEENEGCLDYQNQNSSECFWGTSFPSIGSLVSSSRRQHIPLRPIQHRSAFMIP